MGSWGCPKRRLRAKPVGMEEAIRGLHHLARHRYHEIRQCQLDVLEVFHAGAFSTMAQQNGLKVLPDPTVFSAGRGWSGLVKAERQQLRRAVRELRPRLVVAKLPDRRIELHSASANSFLTEEIGRSIQGALALELADGQVGQGESFLIEASRDDSLWELAGARYLVEQKETAVIHDDFSNKYVTNAQRLQAVVQRSGSTPVAAEERDEPDNRLDFVTMPNSLASKIEEARREDFRDSEQLAQALLVREDF